MLTRMQLFPLNFYKKEKFNGSMGKMNFRLAKEQEEIKGEEGKKEIRMWLLGTVWEGPYCYDASDRKTFQTKKFAFSEEGIQEALDWFNAKGKEFNQA